jgi:hypothetical protein
MTAPGTNCHTLGAIDDLTDLVSDTGFREFRWERQVRHLGVRHRGST